MNPISPYWAKTFENFVSFCHQYYPSFRESIVGASPDEIQAIEQAAGVPLPPEYVAFLRTLGNTPRQALDGFLQYCTYGIEATKALYATPGQRPPRDAVYLWTYEVDTPYDIFLQTGGEERDVRPLIQLGWPIDPETGNPRDEDPDKIVLGGSLLQYLYQDAFLSLRDPLLPHFSQLRERWRGQVSEAAHTRHVTEFPVIATRLGFTPVPYMDQAVVFFNRHDASLKFYSHPGADVIYVRAVEERELGRLCEILSDNLDLVEWS